MSSSIHKFETNLFIYHIIWVTHNSRISERMILYHIKRGEAFILNELEEIEVTHYILDIVKEFQLRILAYNICQDHVHLVLVCQKDKRASIIGKLKGKSSTLYKKKRGIEEPFHLWDQKYNHRPVKNDRYLYNLLEYIKNNRQKHNLATNKEIQILAEEMCISVEEAFSDSDNN